MFKNILAEMRIRQWTKNFFVYAAVLFHGNLFNTQAFAIATEVFISFSLTASGIYFFNDLCDLERDRLNPRKSRRPIASGAIGKASGLFCAAILMTAGLTVAYRINFPVFAIVASYVVLNLLYSAGLKRLMIVDVLIISYGFVSRTIVGALATQIQMTTWFVLCVMFLSLFLALGKRRHDLATSTIAQRSLHVEFVDQLMTIATAGIIMCYSLFTLSTAREMIFTLPLVLYGVFYYLYIVRVKGIGGAPDEILYTERPILITVLLYVVCVILIRDV